MASNSYKVPPPFDEKKLYERWKNEIEQGLAVALSLTGRVRNAALEIVAVDLNTDNGLEKKPHQVDDDYGDKACGNCRCRHDLKKKI